VALPRRPLRWYIGAALAPFIVFWIYRLTGSWRPAFIVTGTIGFLWLPVFRWIYRSPEDHPWLSPEERQDILTNRASATGGTLDASRSPLLGYRTLLSLPQTWGIMIGKGLTDRVWFFTTDRFAIYLVSRGFPIERSLLAFWVPFLAADTGNFSGCGLSSALIQRGWSVGRARKSGRSGWRCSFRPCTSRR
jgi:ACS family hexuronate transporter-like MFS transporter